MRRKNNIFEYVDDAMAAIYKIKSPAKRLDIAFGLWHSTRIILANCLKSLHPDWDEERIQKEVARRMSLGAV